MKKIKVLYFVDRMLRGGIQSLVINWVERFDKSKIQVDFLLLDDGITYEQEEILKNMGCNVYKLKNIWIRKPSDFIKYSKALDTFFSEHNDYNAVHMHSSSKNYFVLKYAQKHGIKIRIAHSHSIDFQTQNYFKKLIGNYFKILLAKYSTDYFACSTMAGKWLFGKKIIKNSRFKVIHNAIDYNKFKYNPEIRDRIRKELNLTNDVILIGHVGRFSEPKNHKFLIEIFEKIYENNSKYKLILIGSGEKEQEIKDVVKKHNLEKAVIFAGFKNNVNEYFNAMDLFLMPSKYEGVPVVGIEAQASGVPVIFSEKVITKEVKISENVFFISLNESAKEWCDKIINLDLKRTDNKKEFKDKGYILEDVIEKLMQIYNK